MKEKIRIKIENEELEADKRTFKSLKEGYGLYGKINLENETYQLSINIIKIKKR